MDRQLCVFYTGNSPWGIAWYLNGLLIPKVTVFRNTRYTFTTEGGNDPGTPAMYHPFYITDNPRGGYLVKSPEDQQVEYSPIVYLVVKILSTMVQLVY